MQVSLNARLPRTLQHGWSPQKTRWRAPPCPRRLVWPRVPRCGIWPLAPRDRRDLRPGAAPPLSRHTKPLRCRNRGRAEAKTDAIQSDPVAERSPPLSRTGRERAAPPRRRAQGPYRSTQSRRRAPGPQNAPPQNDSATDPKTARRSSSRRSRARPSRSTSSRATRSTTSSRRSRTRRASPPTSSA